MSGNGRDSDPELVCATDIEPVATDWWWPGWLPKGKLVLLDGNPGTGKSTLALDVVARLSRGESVSHLGYDRFVSQRSHQHRRRRR